MGRTHGLLSQDQLSVIIPRAFFFALYCNLPQFQPLVKHDMDPGPPSEWIQQSLFQSNHPITWVLNHWPANCLIFDVAVYQGSKLPVPYPKKEGPPKEIRYTNTEDSLRERVRKQTNVPNHTEVSVNQTTAPLPPVESSKIRCYKQFMHNHLVGSWPTPLKNISQLIFGMIITNI